MNKYSRNVVKTSKNQTKINPNGKRKPYQKGVHQAYFDGWIEFVKVCPNCQTTILEDDFDYQKVNDNVVCDGCGSTSQFNTSRMESKRTEYTFEKELTPEPTIKKQRSTTMEYVTADQDDSQKEIDRRANLTQEMRDAEDKVSDAKSDVDTARLELVDLKKETLETNDDMTDGEIAEVESNAEAVSDKQSEIKDLLAVKSAAEDEMQELDNTEYLDSDEGAEFVAWRTSDKKFKKIDDDVADSHITELRKAYRYKGLADKYEIEGSETAKAISTLFSSVEYNTSEAKEKARAKVDAIMKKKVADTAKAIRKKAEYNGHKSNAIFSDLIILD